MPCSRNPLGEGNGTPLQYSCLENPKDGGAWQAADHGVAKSQTLLSDFTFTFMHWRRKWQPTPVFLSFLVISVISSVLVNSCLESPRDGGAWGAAVYGVAQSRTRLKRLSSSWNPLRWHQPSFPRATLIYKGKNDSVTSLP